MAGKTGKYQRWLSEEGLILLEGWARDGLTDADIAHNAGINKATLYRWEQAYPEIKAAVLKGKEVADYRIENALYKRALGYDWEETRVEIAPDGTKKGIQTKRHVPADVTAQIYWLKNRKPSKWRDRPDAAASDTYEDDGLITALDNAVSPDEDDSWLVEGSEE